MYERFFGFRERPFDLVPDPRFLVMMPSHREALSTIHYAIASRKGITVLIGEAGSGKTTVIRAALDSQANGVHCIYLPNPVLTRGEFIEMLAAKFELSSHARSSKAGFLLELEEIVRDRHGRGETTVLVIDEAQSLSVELLEEVRLLANFETAQHKLLPVILAGQPQLSQRLNDPALRQLKQRIALRCELRPLMLEETAAYLAGRIKAAGGVGAEVFTRNAVTLIHERSGGIPRTISVLADNALVSGYALVQRPVCSKVVLEVCGDFNLLQSTDPTKDATVESETQAVIVAPIPALGARGEAAQAAVKGISLLVRDGAPEERDVAVDLAAADAAASRRRLFGVV